MGTVPNKRRERISFFLNHIDPWNTNATALGVNTASVTDLGTKASTASDALAAQEVAQAAAKAATNTLNAALDAMDAAGQGIIKTIRAKAESTNNPELYSLAQIPPPATPAPVGDPGTVTGFGVTLMGDGALDTSWSCSNPPNCTGVVYQLWRRVDDETAFTYLGGSGEKKFLDNTIPAGASEVVYKVQAVRSTGSGPWSQFIVSLGQGVGAMTVTEVKPPKIAA